MLILLLFGLDDAMISHAAELRLTWRDNSNNESGFRIERSTDGSSFSLIDTVDPNRTSYIDQGLTDSVRYWYRVRAFNSAGHSGYTNADSAIASTSSTGGSSGSPPPSGGSSDAGSSGGGGSSSGSNSPPTITQVSDQTVSQGSQSLSFGFTIWDPDSISSSLEVTASSSNQQAVASTSLSVSGVSSNRKVEFDLEPLFFGTFSISLTVSDGEEETESSFTLTVEEAESRPVITEHPVALSVLSGDSASFSISAFSNPAASYQWLFNGSPLTGETSPDLFLGNVSSANAGDYRVRVFNSEGTVFSSIGSLEVVQPASIDLAPIGQNALINESVTLFVEASGSNLVYQWYAGESGDKSNPISGASFSILNTPPLTEDASFWVEVSSQDSAGNPFAAISSESVQIIVSNDRSSTLERLSNVSLRAQMEEGNSGLVAGFVISGTGSKRVLLRALGPSLSQQGVSNPVEDISMNLFRLSGTSQFSLIGSNEDWWRAVNASEIVSVSNLMGAYTLGPESGDAAMLLHLPVGVYGAQLAGSSMGGGTALVEIFDVDAVSGEIGSASLSNISMRANVGSDENVIIAGFVVTGTEMKRVLVRAVGTELINQGVQDALRNPLLQVFKGSQIVAANDDWNDFGGVVSSVTEIVGATSLAPGSKSSALVLWLTPGIYGALASSSDGMSGIVLIEVYEAL